MRSLFYLLLFLVVSGCTYSSGVSVRGLNEAERLLASDPSAAMERLNEVDVTAFRDSASLARWALLYSEAMVANRLAAPNDTIVDIAIAYYGAHNLKSRLQRARHLKALLADNDDNSALASALYLQKEREFFLYRERIARNRLIGGSLFLLLLAVAIIIFQRQRLRLRRVQAEALIAEVACLRESECRISSTLSSMLTDRFRIIDDLCATYYESQGTPGERRRIVEKVKSQIASLQTDSDLFAEMVSCVNDCRCGYLDSLPPLSPDDYRLTVYLACNLSNRTIALLTGQTLEVIYKRKSRLKSRLNRH